MELDRSGGSGCEGSDLQDRFIKERDISPGMVGLSAERRSRLSAV